MCNVKGVAQEYTPISSHHVRKSGRRRRFCLDFGARSSLVNIGRARGSIHLAASTSTWSECLAFVKSISYVRNIHYAWLLCILDSLFTSFCRHRGALENHIIHVFLCWSYADVYRSVSGGVAHSGFWYSQRTRSAMRSWRRPSSATQQKLFFWIATISCAQCLHMFSTLLRWFYDSNLSIILWLKWIIFINTFRLISRYIWVRFRGSVCTQLFIDVFDEDLQLSYEPLTPACPVYQRIAYTISDN